MLQPVAQDNSGHTLVEMMMAILILLVALLGLMEAINLGIRMNLSNKLRSDAMNIADEQMYMQRTIKFDSLANGSQTIQVKMINGFVNYDVNRAITGIGTTANSKQVTITVSWKEREKQKSLAISSIFSKE